MCVILHVDNACDSSIVWVRIHLLGLPSDGIPYEDSAAPYVRSRRQIVHVLGADHTQRADVGFVLFKDRNVVAVTGKNLNGAIFKSYGDLIVYEDTTQCCLGLGAAY